MNNEGRHSRSANDIRSAADRLGARENPPQRDNPPPVGSLVTYTYRDVTPSGKPRFASFLRVRDDP